MRLPKCIANPCLAALIQGAGFPSFDRFAEVVNIRAWEVHGVRLSYDHVRVKRWLGGSKCQYPEVVAAVLSDAWGIPIPVGVIGPNSAMAIDLSLPTFSHGSLLVRWRTWRSS
jgi:hypothetical protein